MDTSSPLQKLFEDFKTDLISAVRSELAQPKMNQPRRMPFRDYLIREKICRHTGYNRRDKGIIQVEKIGNLLYVIE